MEDIAYNDLVFGDTSAHKTAKILQIDPSLDNVKDKIEGVWKNFPKLVISVIGSSEDFKMSARLTDEVKKSIVKVARITGAWIITDATHSGAAKYVGDAVHEFNRQGAGDKNITAVGIPSWYPYLKEGYSVCDAESGNKLLHFNKNVNTKTRKINKHHSHFILLKHRGAWEKSNFRKEIEDQISQTDDKTTTLKCYVMMNGDINTLKTVISALQSQTPAVVVAGSGGMANVLATLHLAKIRPDDVSKELLEKILCENISDSLWLEAEPLLKQCMDTPDGITVFQLDMPCANGKTPASLDLTIIQGLVPGGNGDKSSWTTQVRELFFNALIANELDLVELFFNSGVVINAADILCLYKKSPSDTYIANYIEKNKLSSSLEQLKVSVFSKLMSESFSINHSEDPEKITLEFELFLWSVLLNRSKLSSFFWKFLSEKLASSVAAATLLTSMAKEENVKEKTGDLLVHAEQYNLLTTEILDECYTENAVNTADLLVRKSSLWGNLTCLEMSAGNYSTAGIVVAKGRHKAAKEIISHTSVRFLLNRIWYGVEDVPGGTATLYALLLLPISILLIPVIILSLVLVVYLQCTGQLSDKDEENQESNENIEVATISINKDPGNDIELPTTSRNQSARNDTEGATISINRDAGNDIELPTISRNQSASNDTKLPTTSRNQSASNDTKSKKTGRRRWKKRSVFVYTWKVIRSPFTKYLFNAFSTMILLGIFAYNLLRDYQEICTSLDYVMAVWFCILCLDELYEISQLRNTIVVSKLANDKTNFKTKTYLLLKRYMSKPGNYLDILGITLFFIGFGTRSCLGSSSTAPLATSRVISSFSFTILCGRTLHIFAIHKQIGPKLIMIQRMIWDFVYFCFILFMFILAYGIALQAILYPNETDAYAIVVGIVSRPYWQLYGELQLSEIAFDPSMDEFACASGNATTPANTRRCPEQQPAASVFMAGYLLLANILLLNLLIAILNHTYSDLVEKADLIWNYQRFELIEEYKTVRPPLPTPFSVLYYVYAIICPCCRESHKSVFKPEFSRQKLEELTEFEENVWESFRKTLDDTEKNAIDYKVQTVIDKLKRLSATVKRMDKSLSQIRK